jgi:hypothetical protein
VIILEKYLNDLKSRLPFLKKKVVDEEDDESEFVEEDKTRVSIGATGTDVVSDEDTLALSEDDEDESTGVNVSLVDKLKNLLKPKKQNLKSAKDEKSPADKNKAKIIRGVIVLAIVILIAQEFFPSEEDTSSAPSLTLKPREKPKKKKEALEPVAPADATAPTTPADTTAPTVTTTPPDDTASQPELPTPEETTPPSTVDTSATPEVPSANETTVTPESSPVTVTTEETPNTSPTTTPVLVDEPSSPDSVDGQTTAPDENLTDKILQDLENQAKVTEKRAPKTEYTSPPDYEYKGR